MSEILEGVDELSCPCYALKRMYQEFLDEDHEEDFIDEDEDDRDFSLS